MDQKTKTTLANLDTWKRGLFMVVFTIISGVAKLIVTLVALFQFITLLFKGLTNEEMIPFGQNLSTYLYQITLFLTFKTDDMPFPFRPFPDGTPELNINEDNKENNATNETTTINDEATVDVTDEIRAVKDTKDDATNG
tara:strand:+ start:833 stop:1249 length:417 start_codon:yes stop_codon:yes gene_type:complete